MAPLAELAREVTAEPAEPVEDPAAPPTVRPPEAEVNEAPVTLARIPEALSETSPEAAPEGAVNEAAETV